MFSRVKATAATSITDNPRAITSSWVMLVKPFGVGDLLRIGGIDPVDLGSLEQGIGADFGSAQVRRRNPS